MSIQQSLYAVQDLTFRDFQRKLIPTLPPEKILGVRTPDMRRIAKEYAKHSDIGDFLHDLPHTYHEENCVHAYILESIKDFDICIAEVERFLPYIDNWATCDGLSPKVFACNKDKLLFKIKQWLAGEHPYMIRFAVNMLMKWYLDEDFKPEYLRMVADIHNEEYYVKMVVAWYFATALAKQYDVTLPYIEQQRLEPWTHNKTIQKAIESYRITDEQKIYLRKFRIKQKDL